MGFNEEMLGSFLKSMSSMEKRMDKLEDEKKEIRTLLSVREKDSEKFNKYLERLDDAMDGMREGLAEMRGELNAKRQSNINIESNMNVENKDGDINASQTNN